MSLLEIEGLEVDFPTPTGRAAALKGVDLRVEQGEVVGLVGESGSGKSITCRAVMRMVSNPGRIASGRVSFDGRDVLAMNEKSLRDFRAHAVGMIYQNPFGSLNPVMRIGPQIAETLRVNRGLSRRAAKERALEMLESVGIGEVDKRYRSYPHELSGGMNQRVMIAIATASDPRLLLADEPTTALDVTTQDQILKLLSRMRSERGLSILLVSHDFGVIAQLCDRVAVMYGGFIVESGPIDTVYNRPEHPYTRALLDAVPELDGALSTRRRQPLEGRPPELGESTPGCVFQPRCVHARPDCSTVTMDAAEVGPGHLTACPVRPFADSARQGVAAEEAVDA